MKLAKLMFENCMAQSVSDATRLIREGAVWAGWCKLDCEFFTKFKCSCGGWRRVTNPAEEIAEQTRVKVGNGSWRIVKTLNPAMDDPPMTQLRGIC